MKKVNMNRFNSRLVKAAEEYIEESRFLTFGLAELTFDEAVDCCYYFDWDSERYEDSPEVHVGQYERSVRLYEAYKTMFVNAYIAGIPDIDNCLKSEKSIRRRFERNDLGDFAFALKHNPERAMKYVKTALAGIEKTACNCSETEVNEVEQYIALSRLYSFGTTELSYDEALDCVNYSRWCRGDFGNEKSYKDILAWECSVDIFEAYKNVFTKAVEIDLCDWNKEEWNAIDDEDTPERFAWSEIAGDYGENRYQTLSHWSPVKSAIKGLRKMVDSFEETLTEQQAA